MTDRAKRTLAASLVLTLVGALAAPLLVAAWRSKVDSSAFALYAQTVNTRIERLAVSDSAQYQMILDLWCESKQQNDRRCKGATP